MVPTAAFTFPVLSWGPAAWHKVSAALARGSGGTREAGGSGSMGAGELEAPPVPDCCQTSAAGGGWLQLGSGGKTTEQDGSCEGQPALHGCFLGRGTPVLQHAASSMMWNSVLGTLGDMPRMPGKISGREGVHHARDTE